MRKKLILLYCDLLRKYGRQHWWPADSDYEVLVGAILTQNTAWKNVEQAIANLKKARALSPQKILTIKMQRLQQLIRPSGFYQQKAKRLKLATAKFLQLNHKMSTAKLRKELLSVNGIGEETADSIVLYAFHRPTFVIDAYTRRFCRATAIFNGKTYQDYKRFFERNLPKSVRLFKEFHALLVEWGKRNK